MKLTLAIKHWSVSFVNGTGFNRHLADSFKVVRDNRIFVLVLAATSIWITGSNSYILSVVAILNVVLSVIVTPAIYGRLADIAMKKQKESFKKIIEDNWLNFYITLIAIELPLIVYLVFIQGSMPVMAGKITQHIIAAIIGVLSIYIIPMVFIKGISLTTIPRGIRFLKGTIIYSLPLILLTLLFFIIKAGAELSMTYHFQYFSNNPLMLVTVGLIQNILINFIGLLVFVAACMVLIDGELVVEQ
jgi:hypothetical protein